METVRAGAVTANGAGTDGTVASRIADPVQPAPERGAHAPEAGKYCVQLAGIFAVLHQPNGRIIHVLPASELPCLRNAIDEAVALVGNPVVEHVIEAVCEEWCVTTTALFGDCRAEELVWPRFVAMVLVQEVVPQPDSELAARFGRGRPMATIARRRVADRCSTDRAFAARVERVRARLQEARRP